MTKYLVQLMPAYEATFLEQEVERDGSETAVAVVSNAYLALIGSCLLFESLCYHLLYENRSFIS